MSEEFRQYVAERGDFDALTMDEKRLWGESFDKYSLLRQQQPTQGKPIPRLSPL
jgi:hypothetical protein